MMGGAPPRPSLRSGAESDIGIEPDPVLARLRRTIADYPTNARARAEAVAHALARVCDMGGKDASAWAEALSQAHKLAGSAGSMGFPVLGQLAAALEVLLYQDPRGSRRPPDAVVDVGQPVVSEAAPDEVLDQAALLASRLVADAEALSVERSTLLTPRVFSADLNALAPGGGDRVVAVIGTTDPGPDLEGRLAPFGWTLRRETEAFGTACPAVALVMAEGDPSVVDHVRHWTGAGGPWAGVPWAWVTSHPSAQVRLAAVAAGAAGVLDAPVSAEALLDWCAGLRAHMREVMSRALILDPNPPLAAMIRHVLEGAGMMVECADDPAALWPENGDLPVADGLDLVIIAERANGPAVHDLIRAIRQDPAFDPVALVLVRTAVPHEETAGAWVHLVDAVFGGPLDPVPLASTALSQALRARARREADGIEGEGPVVSAPALEARLESLIERSRARSMPLTVAWMTAMGADGAGLEATLVRLARETLRASDLLGRGPGGGLAVVLPFTPEDQARTRLDGLPERLACLVPGARLTLGRITLDEADWTTGGAVSADGAMKRARALALSDPG